MENQEMPELEVVADASSDKANKLKVPWRRWEVGIGVNPSLWLEKQLLELPEPRYLVINGPMQIGRPSEEFGVPQISLTNDAGVSRRHAELRFSVNGRLELHLFSPRSTTTLSDSKLQHDEVRRIKHGDCLCLGLYSALIFKVRFRNPVLDYFGTLWAEFRNRIFAAQ
jgi:hypothetical protein